MREACGIIGSNGVGPVAEKILFGLIALQHRGQESAGIAVGGRRDCELVCKKAMGLAGEGFTKTDLAQLEGGVGIGHVRYSTVGSSTLAEAQPCCLSGPKHGLALAYNGTLVNYRELRDLIIRRGRQQTTRSDAEILLHLLMDELQGTDDLFEALADSLRGVEGGYSAVVITRNGDLLAFRDPFGFKPLCYGAVSGSFFCASESVAIDMCGGELERDVEPGEAILVTNSGIVKKQFLPCQRRAHCMFEYVYFSRPDSIIEGRSVYDVRMRLGENLAKSCGYDADVIIPVPDTSRPAAEGASRATGIPTAEGLIKNRYIHRTFIMPEQSLRENAVKAKLNPLKSVINGQRIMLIDDSIVRGTTLKGIVNMIRRAGAREVHVGITCPPIISPCFYGIDIATHRELLASHNTVEEIRRQMGADSLGYQTIDGLVDAIGRKREELCMACLTGEYPTPKAQQMATVMRGKPTTKECRYIEAV